MFFESVLFGSYELMFLVKLLLAALAGGVVGFEREIHGRPAGLRTHLLVSVGACLMTIVSEGFFLKYSGFGVDSALRIDPARTAAQIIVGIGFLGGGVILKEGLSVRGLTTAASLWLAAGLGMAMGMGLFGPAVMATALGLFSLFTLKRMEDILNLKKDRYLHLSLVAQDTPGLYEELERLFAERKLRVSDLRADYSLEEKEVRYEFVLTEHHRRIGRELCGVIATLQGVKKIHFK